MAPKHSLAGLKEDEQQLAKRAKSSETPASRSATPADPGAKNNKEQEHEAEEKWKATRDWQVSPFLAKGASKEHELDQFYAVTPTKEWESMKKYNNFISE
jgi:hypothetical protein